jgi:hypothetical protein
MKQNGKEALSEVHNTPDERLSIASLFGANLKESQKLVEGKEEKWVEQRRECPSKLQCKQLV